jgi:hypothetical protein
VQQQYGSHVQADSKKKSWFSRHKLLTALGAVLLLFAATTLFSGGGDDTTATDSPSADQSSPDSPPPDSSAEGPQDQPTGEEPNSPSGGATIGEPVRDGEFEFVVREVERKDSVGKSFLKEKAQGEFVIVYVDVANIGDEPQTLDASSQVLLDEQGREFSTSDAIFSIKNADKVFLENINPGNKVANAPLVYDVPIGTKISTVELHDSPFSDGIAVKLN